MRKGPPLFRVTGPFANRVIDVLLTQQRQDALLALVGLGQHRARSLAQDLGLGESGRLGRIVRVFDPRAGVGQVGRTGRHGVDGGFELVLRGTEAGTGAADRLQARLTGGR